MRALSVSTAIAAAFQGPVLFGHGIGEGYIEFGDFVLALTAPGAPRMPNGVETKLTVARGEPAWIGGGVLRAGSETVGPGPNWNPVPDPRHRPAGGPRLRPHPDLLAGRGPGLTPAGDDVLAGYVAGLVLFHGKRQEALGIAHRAAGRTTKLSATLVHHAARGELPEPAHIYLRNGDPAPLIRFGHSSGRCLLIGLMIGAADPDGESGTLDQFLEAAGLPPVLTARKCS